MLTTPFPASRSRNELTLAFVGRTVSAFGAIGFAALVPFVRDDLELSAPAVGAIVSMIFLGALVATLPAGRLTDRVPAGWMLGVALLGLTAGLVVAAAAPSAALVYVGLGLVGLGYGAAEPPTNVLVSANVPARRRGLFMGVKQTGMTLGGVIGGLVLPSLAAASSWRVALTAPIAVCVAVSLVALRTSGAASETPRDRFAEPVRSASFTGLASYTFVMAGIQTAILAFLAVYLVDRQGLTARTAGYAVAVMLAGATAGRVSWGTVSDRLLASRLLALQVAALGSVAALVLLSVVGASVGLWFVLFLLGFSALGWNGVFMAVAAESVPPSQVGRATGKLMIFSYLGALIAPVLFGLVVDGTDSWPTTWLLAAAVVALLLGAFSVVARRLSAATASQAEPAS